MECLSSPCIFMHDGLCVRPIDITFDLFFFPQKTVAACCQESTLSRSAISKIVRLRVAAFKEGLCTSPASCVSRGDCTCQRYCSRLVGGPLPSPFLNKKNKQLACFFFCSPSPLQVRKCVRQLCCRMRADRKGDDQLMHCAEQAALNLYTAIKLSDESQRKFACDYQR
jgi:hypothetical protein